MKPDPLKLIAYETPPATDISDAAVTMIFMARMTGCHVISEFNQWTLHAEPTSTVNEVLAEYDQASRESYFGKGSEKWNT